MATSPLVAPPCCYSSNEVRIQFLFSVFIGNVLAFAGTVTFDDDLIENSKKKLETLVKVSLFFFHFLFSLGSHSFSLFE